MPSPNEGRLFLWGLGAFFVLAAVLLPTAPGLFALPIALLLVFFVRHAVFWLKHRPLPRQYDAKGSPFPNITESMLAFAFGWWPFGFHEALGIPSWLGLAIALPLVLLGYFLLSRWWIPLRERSKANTP